MPLSEIDLAKLRTIVREELHAAEDDIKYLSPGGQQVAKRKWFEGWRNAQDKRKP
jgi:hypothetical protein